MQNQTETRIESKARRGSETYVTELEEAEFAEIGNRAVGGLDGDDELDKGHLLGAHQIHGGQLVEELVHFSDQTGKKVLRRFGSERLWLTSQI